MSESKYYNLAYHIIKQMARTGLEIEAYYSIHSKLQISIEQSAIKSEREELTKGFCFRVAKGHKIGQSYSNSTDVSKLSATCKNAIKIAEKSPSYKNWSGFPSPQPLKTVKGIFDKRFSEITNEKAFNAVNNTLDPIFSLEKEKSVKISTRGQFILDTELEGIVNSNGIEYEEKRTQAIFFLDGNCKKGDEVGGGGFEIIFSRKFDWTSEDLETLGLNLGEKLISNLGSQKIPAIEGQVILHPDVVSYLCSQIIVPALSAEQIHAKRSPYKDKIGDKVFKSQIDIIDDGLIAGGVNSGSFDGEGVSRRGKTQLIDNGVLKSYLYDHYYSNIFDTNNTSNSKRQTYTSLPKISSTNFIIIGKGNKPLEDIINETKKGVLIRGFSGNCNFENGEFSGVCKNSFLIEKGQKKYTLKDTTISGNFHEFLSKGKFSKDSKVNYQGIEAPALIVDF